MSMFFSAWRLVVRRSLANWRLLSCVIIGVLVAVALLSSTPLYSNVLSDLGLAHALSEQTPELLDVHIYAPNYPLDYADYQKGQAFIDQQASRNISKVIRQEERYIRSQTFYAAWTDRPIPDDSDRPRGYWQVFTGLEKHITLVSGRYPNPIPSGLSPEELADPGLEIEAMIGSQTAERFGVGVDDRLLFISTQGNPPQQITVKLTGIIDPTDPKEEYWFLYSDMFTVAGDGPLTAPLFIPEQTLFDGISRIVPYATATYHWFYYVDVGKINTQNAAAIETGIKRMSEQIITELPNSSLLTSIDSVISSYQQKLLYTQIPLFLLVFQIVGIILYYVVTVANMVIERQSTEIALLRSRGASTLQIFNVYFMEGLIISAFGGAAGPFLGAFVFSLLGRTAPFIPLSGGGLLPVRLTTSVFLLAAGAAVLCLFALLVPAIQAARRGVVHQRQHAARPPRAPFWQRFYLDLVLLVIGGVLYWEMRERGSFLTEHIFEGTDIDPLLLITPILLMVAVAIVFLRLFPLIIGLAARLGKYVTNASMMLGLLYMARNPIHYQRLVLLLMMAASVGMFSASFLGTLERSYDERVMYATGSDVRLEGLYDWTTGKDALWDRYSGVAGVEEVSLAYRGSGQLGAQFAQVGFNIFAIEPESFKNVSWYREDFSEKTLPELMALLAEDQPVEQGIILPDGTEKICLWVRPVMAQPDLFVFVKIRDGKGYYRDYEMGSLGSEDWQCLEAELVKEDSYFVPTPPISLHSIYITRRGTGFWEPPRGVNFDDLAVYGSFSSDPVIVEDFEDLSEWRTVSLASSAWSSTGIPATNDTFTVDTQVVHNGGASGRFGWVSSWSFGYRGLYPNLDARPLSVITSRSFLSRAGVEVGDIVSIRMPGQFIPAVITAVVDYFPTLDPGEGAFIIANLDRAANIRNLKLGGESFYPNEVWLNVTDDEQLRGEALQILGSGKYLARQVYDRQEMLDIARADPLVAAGWGGILMVAFLGVILVSGLGFVVYSYLSAQGRQLEFAILRTQGFSLRQIIGLVGFEQLFIIITGMGIGTLIGLQLSTVMMPFLQLTERGQRVLPPFIAAIDWYTISIAYIILAVAFLFTISLVILFFSRVAIHRVLRMGDV